MNSDFNNFPIPAMCLLKYSNLNSSFQYLSRYSISSFFLMDFKVDAESVS